MIYVMKTNSIQPRVNHQSQTHVVIVIDAFRAFSTASYVLARYPATYIITPKSEVISRLLVNYIDPLIIGKPEKGVDLAYDIPNSPTRVQEVKITNRNIFHRTEAGAKGILFARDADIILATGFVNADATVKYIKELINPRITILPMGHEAITPSIEDDVCSLYIESLIKNERLNLASFLPEIRKGSGKYFFSEDQLQYPSADFERCLEIRRFNFAIRAIVQDDYAILSRCNVNIEKSP